MVVCVSVGVLNSHGLSSRRLNLTAITALTDMKMALWPPEFAESLNILSHSGSDQLPGALAPAG